MSNEILNSLLREYEQKKLKAELDLEKRKEQLYKLIPSFFLSENNLILLELMLQNKFYLSLPILLL